MHFPARLAAHLDRAAFADYSTAAAAVRERLGVARLTPAVAAEVRAAVARRAERTAAAHRDPAARPTREFRLLRATTAAIRPYLVERYRTRGAVGIALTVAPEPRARTVAQTEWVSGRGGYGMVTCGVDFHVHVSPAWRARVAARGLAALDDLVTTHAAPVAEQAGIVVYRAAWVRQRAGYGIGAESGYLAHDPATGAAFHVAAPWSGDAGPAVRRALTGLRRKLRLQATPAAERDAARSERNRERDARRAAGIAKLTGQLARLDLTEVDHVVVARADSLRAGNCEPGTDDFIARWLPGRTEATIGELARAIGRVDLARIAGTDLTLARQLGAACLVAVRRDRNARRLIGA